jgi:hypothetical protein
MHRYIEETKKERFVSFTRVCVQSPQRSDWMPRFRLHYHPAYGGVVVNMPHRFTLAVWHTKQHGTVRYLYIY